MGGFAAVVNRYVGPAPVPLYRLVLCARLFLDGIDAESAGTAIGGEDDLSTFNAAHIAQATLPLMHLAVARAHVALNPSVPEGMEVAAREGVLEGLQRFLLRHRRPFVAQERRWRIIDGGFRRRGQSVRRAAT